MTAIALWVPAWQALERRVFDALTVHTAPGELRQPIALIGITDEAIRELKLEWPWPRRFHGELVNRIAQGGAAVIALDLVFDTPRRTPEDDRVFAQAIARAGNVVLAADFREQDDALYKKWTAGRADPGAHPGGRPAGARTIPFDPDQFVRQVPAEPDAFWRQIIKVLQIRAPTEAVPPLPDTGALIRYLGPDSPPPLRPDPVPPRAAGEPRGAEGRLRRAHRDRGPRPARRARAGARVVDLFATPFLPYSGTPPRDSRSTRRSSTTRSRAPRSGPCCPRPTRRSQPSPPSSSSSAMRRWRPLVATATLFVVIATFVALAWYLFAHERLWIALATPVAVAVLAYVGYVLKAYFSEYQRKREIQQAFSRYLSPDLVEQIANDPRKLELGGETREITVMFTDLAGFTKLTEKFPPPVVQRCSSSTSPR
jgi:adenylate cyclase